MKAHVFDTGKAAQLAADKVNEASNIPVRGGETVAYCLAETVQGVHFIMADDFTEAILGPDDITDVTFK